MTFLYLVPTGMNAPENPGWGSWAGRYGLQESANDKPHYWANQVDTWNGTSHRDNSLIRWAADLQNDFRARLDWCIKGKEEANHRPIALLNGDAGLESFYINAKAGTNLRLSAEGSTDPDGNQISYRWELYPEASRYTGKARIADAGQKVATLQVPSDTGELHVILILHFQSGWIRFDRRWMGSAGITDFPESPPEQAGSNWSVMF